MHTKELPFAVDEKLFLEMTVYYEKLLGLPPLASKIYTLLRFDFERHGVCFDGLVCYFSAGKSSVSENLNLLLNKKLIVDFQKCDVRKRFFKINESYMQQRFEEISQQLKQELDVLDRLDALRQKKNIPMKYPERVVIYKNLLQNNLHNFQKSLKQLENEE